MLGGWEGLGDYSFGLHELKASFGILGLGTLSPQPRNPFFPKLIFCGQLGTRLGLLRVFEVLI